ncbi:hypothetical protein DY000_02052647, partial [Brassica cretica]
FENPNSDCGTQESPGLFSFPLNLDTEEDTIGGSLSKRPMGVKKSKLKRKNDDQTSLVINTMEVGNKKLLKQLEKTSTQRQQLLEIQSKNYALKKLREENKILFCDVNSIQNPKVCAYMQSEQNRILSERSEEQPAQQPPQTSTSFGQFFNNLNGSGSDLPDY